jgi:hypothetical protein
VAPASRGQRDTGAVDPIRPGAVGQIGGFGRGRPKQLARPGSLAGDPPRCRQISPARSAAAWRASGAAQMRPATAPAASSPQGSSLRCPRLQRLRRFWRSTRLLDRLRGMPRSGWAVGSLVRGLPDPGPLAREPAMWAPPVVLVVPVERPARGPGNREQQKRTGPRWEAVAWLSQPAQRRAPGARRRAWGPQPSASPRVRPGLPRAPRQPHLSAPPGQAATRGGRSGRAAATAQRARA